MSPPLDDLYLEWLYREARLDPDLHNVGASYWGLFRQLYTKEFVWTVPMDDNRVEDARELRAEFIELSDIDYVDPSWMTLGCSILEIMMSLSRRMAFAGDAEPHHWFWTLINNIGLLTYSDAKKFPRDDVDEVLDRIIWRKYDYSGNGGFFPLKNPLADQREVELWYQMQAYLIENC